MPAFVPSCQETRLITQQGGADELINCNLFVLLSHSSSKELYERPQQTPTSGADWLSADSTFIDPDFASQANIPTQSLPSPKGVFALDSRLLAQATHLTAPLTLLLSGHHRETIIFLLFFFFFFIIILLPHSQVLLGVPWLKSHNHHIDWFASRTLNWSVYCHSHCLHSVTPLLVPPLNTMTFPQFPLTITTLATYLARTVRSHCLPTDHMTVQLTYFLVRLFLRAMNETPWSPTSKTH